MDLHQLQLLRELGERGSLAAVARALHVSASAVSQQLAALQRRAEVPLTERRGRNLVLTGAGQALARAAVDVSVAMRSAEQAVSHYLQDPRATVNLCGFNSAGLTYFGPLLQALSGEDSPRLICHDRDVGQEDFPALAADYDVVIAHRLEHSPPWPESITVLPLVREPLDVAMSETHPLAIEPSVSVADLITEEWVSVQDGFPLTSALQALAVHAGQPLDVTHRINEFFIAAAIVSAGSAVSLMPRHTAAPPPGSGIVLKPIHDLPLARRVDILCRPEALQRVAVLQVVDALRRIPFSN
ncbi:LysR family transcriptional regulator [Arthrobacter sp. zg-Y20]|uniref:LysR family transcriptional regulator n=1 Tax=unclassified Arthrobacter TaxID=235627 RepID=UPI001D133816|nr:MULTISPECIES: LysR family transcriptional regulator [unclassified Arthrobacter]MCC3274479.1 LysR family transcriptional regulator [Arthrobacter sp. zg-Y20]MDK1314636.1 LysR family transcriptional regulator [Arthrobacter sp. zg.Y20]WIB07617.1 LysR family transcriptional regulator [Arthrobacter sp. zg-Y20]